MIDLLFGVCVALLAFQCYCIGYSAGLVKGEYPKRKIKDKEDSREILETKIGLN